MHPIEQAWHGFREDNPRVMLILDRIAQAPNKPVPAEVVVPSGMLGVLLTESAFLMHRTHELSRNDVIAVNRGAYLGSVWAAYRESKRIFVITKELAQELQKLREPISWPARSLRLAARAIALDFSNVLGMDHPDAYIVVSYDIPYNEYVHKRDDVNSALDRPLSLNIMRVRLDGPPELLCCLPINDNGGTLWDSYVEVNKSAAADLRNIIEKMCEKDHETSDPMIIQAHEALQGAWTDEIHQHIANIVGGPEGLITRTPIIPLVINTLYYLLGDPDVIRDVHPGARPPRFKVKLTPKMHLQRQSLVAPTVQLIGERFTAAIKHYEEERERLKGEEAKGGTKCPHLRRPHLHTYWKGPDRDQLSIKFLGWIGVAGAEVPATLKEAYAPVITPVE